MVKTKLAAKMEEGCENSQPAIGANFFFFSKTKYFFYYYFIYLYTPK